MELVHPTLIVICGWPFSGKTTLATAAKKELDVHHVDIDEVRNLAVGVPHPHPNESEELMQRDRQEMAISYRLLIACADENLAAGRSIIITATFSRTSGQQMVLDLMVKHPTARLSVIQCVPEGDTDYEVHRLMSNRKFGETGFSSVNSPERYFEVKGRYERIVLTHLEVATWGSSNSVEDELALALDYILATQLHDPYIPSA